MSIYGKSDWFKGCRVLFKECLDSGHQLDFFILCVILQRCRYNGNRQELEMGEAFIGIRELAKIVRASRKEVQTSLKRLEKKGATKSPQSSHKGTTIKVLLPSLYEDTRRHEVATKSPQSRTNIDKIRRDKIYGYDNQPHCFWNVFLELYTKKYNTPPSRNKNTDLWSRQIAGICDEPDWMDLVKNFLSDDRDYYTKRKHPLYALVKDLDQHRPAKKNKHHEPIKPEGEYL